jgi:hypothetical protein
VLTVDDRRVDRALAAPGDAVGGEDEHLGASGASGVIRSGGAAAAATLTSAGVGLGGELGVGDDALVWPRPSAPHLGLTSRWKPIDPMNSVLVARRGCAPS